MKALVSMTLVAGLVTVALVPSASAGHHHRRYYCWNQWQPAYSAPVYGQQWAAPAVPPGPAAVPSTAQMQNQAYRSFSAEPSATAAPAVAPAAPMYAPAPGGYYGGTPGNLNSSQNNPAGDYSYAPASGVATGGPPSLGGTANSPAGNSNRISTYGGGYGYGGGSSIGGTANNPSGY